MGRAIGVYMLSIGPLYSIHSGEMSEDTQGVHIRIS